MLHALEDAIAPKEHPAEDPAPDLPRVAGNALDDVDLGASLGRKSYKKRLDDLQRRLFDLCESRGGGAAAQRARLRRSGCGGQGGAIRRITRALDARDYHVVPIAAPTAQEARYHYLWRFWRELPPAGRLVVFDRSWYGRVLVERVEGFASQSEWSWAYDEIVDFERDLVEARTLVLKFWLQIDPDEQLRRFREREATPYKKYKITDEDYRNRGKWDAYQEAVGEMVARTHRDDAPWHLIPANDKRHARVAILTHLATRSRDALENQKSQP